MLVNLYLLSLPERTRRQADNENFYVARLEAKPSAKFKQAKEADFCELRKTFTATRLSRYE